MTRNVNYVLRAKPEYAAEVAAWHTAELAAMNRQNDQIKEFIAKTENCTAVSVSQGFNGIYVLGYVTEDVHAELPEGWRRERSDRSVAVPALKKPGGRQNKAMLDQMKFDRTAAPGLPQVITGQGRMGMFGVHEYDGQWFAELGFVPSESNAIDTVIWETVPMSLYYTAKEIHEAAHPEEVEA